MHDPSAHPTEITRLLARMGPEATASAQDREAVIARVYPELRALAASLMARERADHTLQPTALVHEAWLKLVDGPRIGFEGRAHFFGIAARCMRQVLVDHARARATDKRGGDWARVTLVDDVLALDDPDIEMIALDDALTRFAVLDERAARVAEMRLFAGMTVPEIAVELGVSPRTVDGDWATARAWLTRELAEA